VTGDTMKGIRGRESSASRDMVLIRDDDAEVIPRPKPIDGLTPEEADEWIAICNAVPAGYFVPATWNIVASYCRHVVVERHLAQMIAHLQRTHSPTWAKFDYNKYERLIGQMRRESSIIASLLRTLRLTHLSNYAHDRTELPAEVPKPWLS
jgi:cell division protein YceG involved in septum cleavage